MEYIIENWALVVAVLALSAVFVLAAARFVRLPSAGQLEKVQNWLLLAVSEAERELGGGTGELKLRKVYDKFLGKFPWLAKVIPFKRFVSMVRKALEEMEAMLAENPKAREYVEGLEDMEEEEKNSIHAVGVPGPPSYAPAYCDDNYPSGAHTVGTSSMGIGTPSMGVGPATRAEEEENALSV